MMYPRIVYIHGLEENKNIVKELHKSFPQQTIVSDSYSLDTPQQALEEIVKSLHHTDIIVAHSLGAFLVLLLAAKGVINNPIICINPLINPDDLHSIHSNETIINRYRKLLIKPEELKRKNRISVILSTNDVVCDSTKSAQFFDNTSILTYSISDTHNIKEANSFPLLGYVILRYIRDIQMKNHVDTYYARIIQQQTITNSEQKPLVSKEEKERLLGITRKIGNENRAKLKAEYQQKIECQMVLFGNTVTEKVITKLQEDKDRMLDLSDLGNSLGAALKQYIEQQDEFDTSIEDLISGLYHGLCK